MSELVSTRPVGMVYTYANTITAVGAGDGSWKVAVGAYNTMWIMYGLVVATAFAAGRTVTIQIYDKNDVLFATLFSGNLTTGQSVPVGWAYPTSIAVGGAPPFNPDSCLDQSDYLLIKVASMAAADQATLRLKVRMLAKQPTVTVTTP